MANEDFMTGYQDLYNAQRKEKGSSLTAEEAEALDPNAYSRLFWRNRFDAQKILDSLESRYNEASQKAHDDYYKNLGMSARNDDGTLRSDKPVFNFTHNGNGVSLRDKNTIRNYAATGDNERAMDVLRNLTGYGYDGYDSTTAAMTGIINRLNELEVEFANAQTPEEKQRIQNEALELDKQAGALNEYMGLAGSKWDEANNKYSDVSQVTADELLQPKSKPVDANEMDYRKQKNSLNHQKIGRGIADLFRSLGNGIQAVNGAKVGEYNFNRPYELLDQKQKMLYDTYVARMEQLRREQVAREQAADAARRAEAAATLKHKRDLELEDRKHLNRMDEQQEKDAAAYARVLERSGVSKEKATKIANASAKAGKKHESVISVGDTSFGFDKNEGSNTLAWQLYAYMKEILKADMTEIKTGSGLFSTVDPVATINFYLGGKATDEVKESVKSWLRSKSYAGVDEMKLEEDGSEDPAKVEDRKEAVVEKDKEDKKENPLTQFS